ncbi:hypothetical protein GC170_18950 [bacterium]|nr:hypothetical protein [bacterium]
MSLEIAAYLGHSASRNLLGTKAPEPFELASMKHGGDRHWRMALRAIGHEPVAKAACSIAEIALTEYSKNPDSVSEVDSQARMAVESLIAWRNAPISLETRAAVERNAIRFALNVNVGGVLRDHSGYCGQSLGRILGKCASIVLAPENPRYVRWFGEAAESLCMDFPVSEEHLCMTIAKVFQPCFSIDEQ